MCGDQSVNVPSGQITVTSTVANYGYLQAWLEATADFDLPLQFYNTSTLAWVNVATSASGTGSEWIQFATSGASLPTTRSGCPPIPYHARTHTLTTHDTQPKC